MGVLDDAIREHLELKRLHGAAEEDLRRQEVEALGPARRRVAPEEAEDTDGAGGQEPAGDEPAAAADAGPVTDEPALPAMDEPEPAAAEPADEAPQAEVEPHAEIEPHAADDRPALADDPYADEAALHEPPSEEHELPFAEEAAPEPPPANEPPLRLSDADLPDTQESSAVRAGDTPPRGFEVLDDDELLDEDEDVADEPAEDEPDSEDVLEDTPDFLQETPEHDRLWFEQKPPRDFDFD